MIKKRGLGGFLQCVLCALHFLSIFVLKVKIKFPLSVRVEAMGVVQLKVSGLEIGNFLRELFWPLLVKTSSPKL